MQYDVNCKQCVRITLKILIQLGKLSTDTPCYMTGHDWI